MIFQSEIKPIHPISYNRIDSSLPGVPIIAEGTVSNVEHKLAFRPWRTAGFDSPARSSSPLKSASPALADTVANPFVLTGL